jgi:ankyrin repeat protein
VIRQNPKNEILRNNIIGLIEYGAMINVVDSDGRDPIMHAIINNNTMVVKILLENKRALRVNPEGQDKAGRSAVHYVVNPIRYGSFENVEILQLLHKYGFNLKLQDA